MAGQRESVGRQDQQERMDATAGRSSMDGVRGAVVTVAYDGTTAVTRKQVGVAGSSSNSIWFGGWIGKRKLTPHSVSVKVAGYEDATAQVQLQAGQTVDVSIKLKKKKLAEVEPTLEIEILGSSASKADPLYGRSQR